MINDYEVKELIRMLREKQSRDNRKLLDTAANTLEELLDYPSYWPDNARAFTTPFRERYILVQRISSNNWQYIEYGTDYRIKKDMMFCGNISLRGITSIICTLLDIDEEKILDVSPDELLLASEEVEIFGHPRWNRKL